MPRGDASSSTVLGRRVPAALGAVAALLLGVLAPVAPAHAAAGDVVVEPGQLAVTFVARVCDDYPDIMANRARNNLQESLRDLGKDTVYTAGQPISPSIETPNQPKCRVLRGWDFQLGRGITGKSPGTMNLSTVTQPFGTAVKTAGPIPELDSRGVDTGRTIDGAVTIMLDAAQIAAAQRPSGLWAQGGIGAQTLPTSGQYGFGALRCAVDNLNGDNVETIGYPQGARHVFCYYYAVSPPPVAGSITVVKEVKDAIKVSTPFRFVGNISYTQDQSFTLDAAPGSPGKQTFIRGEVTGGAPAWNFREDTTPGWELAGDPVCTSKAGSAWAFDAKTGVVSVELKAKDDVVCTFTNQRARTGAAFLGKVAIGGTGSFPFAIDVPDPAADVKTTVDVTAPLRLFPVASTQGGLPGKYTATETLPADSDAGFWGLDAVVCTDGNTVESLPITANGRDRTATGTIVEKMTYRCVFINRFTSKAAITILKTSKGGTGDFEYAVVSADDDGPEHRLTAKTVTPGDAVQAVASAGSTPPEGLPINSEWEVQEFLPAPTAAGFWRVVEADCGAAGRVERPPNAVVRVKVTEKQPQVKCSFVNEFVTQGALEVVKRTTADSTARPDDAILVWKCDDASTGTVAVAPGEAENTTGVVETSGFRECTVTEARSGASEHTDVTTKATITVNGTAAAYTLGDEFLVSPADTVVVTVDNTVTAVLPDTGAGSSGMWAAALGGTLIAAGAVLVAMRRRRA